MAASKLQNKMLVKYTIMTKVLGHPFVMNGLTTSVISRSTNFNVKACNDILGNSVL